MWPRDLLLARFFTPALGWPARTSCRPSCRVARLLTSLVPHSPHSIRALVSSPTGCFASRLPLAPPSTRPHAAFFPPPPSTRFVRASRLRPKPIRVIWARRSCCPRKESGVLRLVLPPTVGPAQPVDREPSFLRAIGGRHPARMPTGCTSACLSRGRPLLSSRWGARGSTAQGERVTAGERRTSSNGEHWPPLDGFLPQAWSGMGWNGGDPPLHRLCFRRVVAPSWACVRPRARRSTVLGGQLFGVCSPLGSVGR